MAFLTITPVGGGTTLTVRVQRQGASERPPVTVGESARAFDGTLRQTVRAEKREFQFATAALDNAAEVAFRAAVAPGGVVGTPVTVGGDAMLPATTLTAVVRITGGEWVGNMPASRRRLLSFSVQQV